MLYLRPTDRSSPTYLPSTAFPQEVCCTVYMRVSPYSGDIQSTYPDTNLPSPVWVLIFGVQIGVQNG